MKYYFAPMEGITRYIYRNAVWRHFPYVDKFYAPFIQPNPRRVFVPKEERDILPEHNKGIPLVPQILTCSADGFIRAGRALEDYGYSEVNLNLGCPSGTVVSKGKGAGMLADAEKLERFLDEVFSVTWNAKITVKTRLGVTEEDDFLELMRVFLSFPIAELIIHPRYRTDFYKGTPRMEQFRQALEMMDQSGGQAEEGLSGMNICYNGNIFTKQDYSQLLLKCQKESRRSEEQTETLTVDDFGSRLNSVMIGRGLLANPALIREIKGGPPLTMEELQSFHEDILEHYRKLDFGETNTIYKMKELWNYWGTIITGAPRELKRIRKAVRYADYLPAVQALFRVGTFTRTRGYLPAM